MRRRMVKCGLAIWLASAGTVTAQVSDPYHTNGSASEDNCHCYTLTREIPNQSGSVWNINKIDLHQSFDFKFNVYLGCLDYDGADGIVFVLQPISTSVGTQGQGLGYKGVTPSVGIAIDTYQNADDYDPYFDNISILKNGNIVHGSDDLASPVSALASGGNIEDCRFHTFRISWNADTKLLKAQIDDTDRVSATVDMVKDIFGNDPMVFWGFTGATGGKVNVQRVCTSLDPNFQVPEGLNVCYPSTINFIDSSTSFGSIEKWFWDFGDGQTDSVRNPAPHVYKKPGEYKVNLAIVGNDECLSDSIHKTVVMGSKPMAQFNYVPQQPCKGAPVFVTDSSMVSVGTIDEWNWKIAGQRFTVKNPGAMTLTGSNRVELQVKTLEGCVSDLMVDSIDVRNIPCPDFYMPSAFTPNDDGHNDKFEFVASGMASIDMFRIFNRAGTLMYASNKIRAGWDGTYKGQPQPPDTYVYEIRGKDLSGAVHFKKGTFILIR